MSRINRLVDNSRLIFENTKLNRYEYIKQRTILKFITAKQQQYWNLTIKDLFQAGPQNTSNFLLGATQNQQQQQQQQQKQNSIFGNIPGPTSNQQQGSMSIFGNTQNQTSSQFSFNQQGSNQNQNKGTSLFGQFGAGTTATSQQPSLFSQNQMAQPQTGSLFGQNTNQNQMSGQNQQGQSLGLLNQSQQNPQSTSQQTSIFGQNTQNPSTNQNSSMFSQPNQNQNQNSNMQANTQNQQQSGNIFLQGSANSLFPNTTQNQNAGGTQQQQQQQQQQQSLFGVQPTNTQNQNTTAQQAQPSSLFSNQTKPPQSNQSPLFAGAPSQGTAQQQPQSQLFSGQPQQQTSQTQSQANTKPPQTQQQTSLFGVQSQTQPQNQPQAESTTSLFNQQKPSQTQPPTQNTSNTNLFGLNTQNQSSDKPATSLFSQNTQNQQTTNQNKPQTSTTPSLFQQPITQQTTQQPDKKDQDKTTSAQPTTTTQTSLFQTKPSDQAQPQISFTNDTTTKTPQTQSTQPAQTSLFSQQPTTIQPAQTDKDKPLPTATATATTAPATTTTEKPTSLFSQGIASGLPSATPQKPLTSPLTQIQSKNLGPKAQTILSACLQSNRYLYDFSGFDLDISLEENLEILRHQAISEKLIKGLLSYYERDNEPQEYQNEFKNGKLKFRSGRTLNQWTQNLVLEISNHLNLGLKQSFELLDFYFYNHEDQAKYCERHWEEKKQDLNPSEKKVLLQRIAQTFETDKIYLLRSIERLLLNSQKSEQFEKYLQSKTDFFDNLWKNFEQICKKTIPNHLQEIEEQEEWIVQSLKQQYHLLRSIFLYISLGKEIKPKKYLEILQTFQDQHFQGSYRIIKTAVDLKDYYEIQQKIVSEIANICILITIAGLGIENLIAGSQFEEISTKIRPFTLLSECGKEIQEFLIKQRGSVYFSPVQVAWYALLQLILDQSDSKTKDIALKLATQKQLDDLAKSFEDINYKLILQTICEREFDPANKDPILYFFKKIVLNWTSLLAQITNPEEDPEYDQLSDLAIKCLDHFLLIRKFWEEDFAIRGELYKLIENQLDYFPYQNDKLIKIFNVILGTQSESYADKVIQLLANLRTYTTEARDARSTGIQVRQQDIMTFGIILEAGTNYEIKESPIERKQLIERNFIKYNFWQYLYSIWSTALNQFARKPGEFHNLNQSLIDYIKFTCQLIITDVTQTGLLEGYMTNKEPKSPNSYQGSAIILLILDSIYQFQRILKPQFELFSLLIGALNELYKRVNYRKLVVSLIHSYKTEGYKFSQVQGSVIHPIFEIFITLKKYEFQNEYISGKHDLYISLLQFGYDILLNEEYYLDNFCTEKYSKEQHQKFIKSDTYMSNTSKIINFLHYEVNDWHDYVDIPNVKQCFLALADVPTSYCYSSFIDDLFSLIFQKLLLEYPKIGNRIDQQPKKWIIGKLIFKIIDLMLQKFQVSLERRSVQFKSPVEIPLLIHMMSYLNSADLPQIFIQTLEVVINSNIASGKKAFSRASPLMIENKEWQQFEIQPEVNFHIHRVRDLIASCLGALDTILSLAEIQNESSWSNSDNSNLQQNYIERISLVNFFSKIFTDRENMFYYEINDYSKIRSPVRINIVLAIASYINFEQIKEIEIQNTTYKENEFSSIESFAKFDFGLSRSYFLKPRNKLQIFDDSVSSLSLRILNKLVIIWEAQTSARKPSLYENLSFVFSAGHSVKISGTFNEVCNLLMSILSKFEDLLEEANCVMELLINLLLSQRSFLEPFLKPNINETLMKKFIEFTDKVFSSTYIESKSLACKVIYFIYEVLNRSNSYQKFVDKLRENNCVKIITMINYIFEKLQPDEDIPSLYGQFASLKNFTRIEDLITPENIFKRNVLAQEIQLTLQSVFITAIALRFLSQELLATHLRARNLETISKKELEACVKGFFDKHSLNWIKQLTLNDLFRISSYKNFAKLTKEMQYASNYQDESEMILENNQYSYDSRYSYIQDRQSFQIFTWKEFQSFRRKGLAADTDENKKSKGGIVSKSVFRILDINTYGYGLDFCFDTQEVYFALKACGYNERFTWDFVQTLQQYNIESSLQDAYFRCFEALIILYEVVNSCGQKGLAFSTQIQKAQLPKIEDEKIKNILAPNDLRLLNINATQINLEQGMQYFLSKQENDTPEAWISLIEQISSLSKQLFYSIPIALREKNEFTITNTPFMSNLSQRFKLLSKTFDILEFSVSVLKHIKAQIDINKLFSKDLLAEILLHLDKIFDFILQADNIKQLNLWELIMFCLSYLIYLAEACQTGFKLGQEDSIKIENLFNHLEKLLKKNTPQDHLIVACLDLLFKIKSDTMYTLIKKDDKKILKILLQKITRDDTLPLFISIMKFFSSICSQKIGAELLRDCGVVGDICQLKYFKGIESAPNYENGCKSKFYCAWCWLLFFFREFCSQLQDESGFIVLAAPFLKIYFPRIFKTLQYSPNGREDVIDTKKYLLAGSSSIKFSLAFIEELELICSLLMIFYSKKNTFFIANRELFDELLYILTNNTIRIFRANFSFNENFIPFTQYESLLNEIFPSETKKDGQPFGQFTSRDIVTSKASPFRRSTFQSDQSRQNSTYENNLLIDHYYPSVFIFKVELSFTNVIFYLMMAIKYGIETYDFFEEINRRDYQSQIQRFRQLDINSNIRRIKSDLNYWENFSQSIFDVQTYISHTYSKWVNNENIIQNILQKIELVYSSYECFIQNGSLNTTFIRSNYRILLEKCNKNLEIAFILSFKHFLLYDDFKKIVDLPDSVEAIVQTFKEKSKKILEENISPIGRGPKLISDDSLEFLKKVADAYEKMLNT